MADIAAGYALRKSCPEGKEMVLLKLSRKELKGKTKKDFGAGDVLSVGKYFVHFNGGKTYANTDNRIVPLKESQMPQFIHSLVF